MSTMTAQLKTTAIRIPIGGGTWLNADITTPPGAKGLVLFAHGSGSGRHSPRNRYVASELNFLQMATVLADLLTGEEEQIDDRTGVLRFDIPLLTNRLVQMVDWATTYVSLATLPIGVLGASTDAAAARPARQLRVEHDPTGFPYSFSWFAKLRLEVVIDDPELRQMHLSSEGDTVLLAVTPQFVPELIETVESVKAGGDDFGFGPETRRKAPLGVGSRDRESLHLCCWQPMRGTE